MKHLGLLCLASATKELPHVSLGSKARKQQRKANTVARNQAVPAAATAAVDPLRHMRAARQPDHVVAHALPRITIPFQ